MAKNLTEEQILSHKLAHAPTFFPTKLASLFNDDLFFLGVIDPTKRVFNIQLNKELAEYLYNALGKFLEKKQVHYNID